MAEEQKPRKCSPAFVKAREERRKFARGRCELCKGRAYKLECHHPISRDEEFNAYKLDDDGKITWRDVIMLCVPCHDVQTDRIRDERNARKRLTEAPPPAAHSRNLPEPEKNNVDVYDTLRWDFSAGPPQQPHGQPVRSLEEGDCQDHRQAEED